MVAYTMSLFNLACFYACFYAYFYTYFALILQRHRFIIVAATWQVLYASLSTTRARQKVVLARGSLGAV